MLHASQDDDQDEKKRKDRMAMILAAHMYRRIQALEL